LSNTDDTTKKYYRTWPIKTWKQTWGMFSNSGVRNKSAQVIMIPETIADTPDFAPLSWLTADLEKDPV